MKPSNKLRIKTLHRGWSDKDNVMLHACFQILTDFIEDEGRYDNTDWDCDEQHRQTRKEIDELYAWWKKRVQDEEEDIIENVLDPVHYEIDNQMLIRLIKIREFLWT